MWAALKSPLLLGNDLREMDATTLSIINNPAIIALSQDPRGKAVQRVARNDSVPKDEYGVGETHVWAGPLDNGDQVVILFNAANEDQDITASLNEIFVMDGPGGSAPQVQQTWAIHDLWSNGYSRMTKVDADAILMARSSSARKDVFANLRTYNSTQMSYADGLKAGDSRLFGEKIGTVAARGEISMRVPRHACKVLRLRAVEGEDHKRKSLVKQEL
jgi:alpha-galactosidase